MLTWRFRHARRARAEPSTALAPFRYRQFRWLWAGQAISTVGGLFYTIALPWYVLADHGGTVLLGTLLACYGVPRLAGIAIGGALSDRLHPWSVMLASDLARAVLTGLFATVAATLPPRPMTLIPLAAVLGLASGVFTPAARSIVPSLLPDGELQAGNALLAGAQQSAIFVAPLAAGLVVASVGTSFAFAVDAASFVASAVSLAGVHSMHREQELTRRPAPAQASLQPPENCEPALKIAEHWADGPDTPTTLRRTLARERGLLIFLIIVFAGNMGEGAVGDVALPALAHGPLHEGAFGYGVLVASLGAGGILGTLVAARLATPRRPATVSSTLFLIASTCLAAVPYLGGAGAAGVMLFLFGGLLGLGNTIEITMLQRWTPPRLLGRVMSAATLAQGGFYPLSVLLGGVIVHAAGPSIVFLAAGTLIALSTSYALTQPAWRNFAAGSAVVTNSGKDNE
ncbi:MFS transporter [Conexibacter sp. S30A1]|uniref:MFS transporter n=1 Tax=Conexibacter sp. S30A1 TaxID=2937800 RepID=UPI00200E1B80|nr:MFS transporter [Conexibacter sp. S30A1]